MKRVAWLVAGVVVLAAILLVVIGHSAKDAKHTPCNVPTAVSPQASDGGTVRVVEQGFTQVGQDRGGVSLGAMLENTSKLVAYRTRITFHILDGAGHDAAASHQTQLIQEIPIILPRQRVGAGTFAYVADAPQFAKATVATFTLEVSGTQWLPSGAGIPAYHATYAGGEPGVIRYTIANPSCRALESRGVAAVLRDSKGTIVGGALGVVASPQRTPCSPGTYPESMASQGDVPSTADSARTEVFPYCDLSAKPQSLASDAPFN